MNQENIALQGRVRLMVVWVLAAIWLSGLVAANAAKGGLVGSIGAAAEGLGMLAFVVAHGSGSNGWRGLLAFVLIAMAASFTLEATSIAHGFPFGYYVHNMPGPRLLGVPPVIPPGYAVLGWMAWSVARVLTREHPSRPTRRDMFLTPVVGAFVLAGYDLPYDPIGGTVLHGWTYRYPSGQFGVPLSNFLGWLFTGWVIFQLFALVEARFAPKPVAARKAFWLAPAVVWCGMALQYPIMLAHAPAGEVVLGARRFLVADVYEAGAIVSLFTLVFTGLLAAVRLASSSWPQQPGEGGLRDF